MLQHDPTTGSFQYEIGKLVLSPTTVGVGDLVMTIIVGSSGFVVYLVTKYLFKQWASNLMIMIVAAHVAIEDNGRKELQRSELRI